MEFKVGDLVYHNKYHRGLLEIVEVHNSYVVVGKYSRIGISKSTIRFPTAEEFRHHSDMVLKFKQGVF